MLLFTLAIGCVHALSLVPAGETNAQSAGVAVQVGAKQWSGEPIDLPSIVTPLYVSVHNASDQPVRLRYRDLSLASGGMQASAIPPFRIQRPEGSAMALPETAFASDGFFLYSPYATFYPQAPIWAGGPWDFDPAFYDRLYGTWQPSLPTKDMLRMALPEGVLQPGGSASGFLYFQTPQQAGAAQFTIEIVQAKTREPLGTIAIPMTLR
jgi:hypothetical protein